MEDESQPVARLARIRCLLLPTLTDCASGVLGVLLGGALVGLLLARGPTGPMPPPTPGLVEGIGFAIPSNTVRYVAHQLIARGWVARPYLALEYVTSTPRLAAIYNLPVDYGLYVQRAERGSALERATCDRR